MKKMYQLLTIFGLLLSSQTIFAQCQVATVSTDSGANVVYTCPQDGNSDIINFTNTNTSASNFAYAITDNDNSILAIETGDSFDFDPAPAGNCLVWGFSYTGTITAEPGQSVFSTSFSDGCWLISPNAISVIRQTPEGGTVSTPTGETEVYTCLNDGIPDYVGFATTSNSEANYTYVVTDDQNNILGLPPTPFLDFAGAGVGVCRVWGLSYTGELTAGMGDNAATTALSDNCFELSSNFITVTRNEVDGGEISTPDGDNFVEVCTLDGAPDVVQFTNTSTTSANYVYAITDAENNLLTTTAASSFDFDDVPAGTCRVWGFSFTGDITAQMGESVFSTQFSEGCWEISTSAITVNRIGVDGGTVAMPSGATTRYTCPGDGNDDIVMFTHSTTSTVNYAYVITDDQNNILGIPPGNSQNFEGAGVGECYVWGLAYTGTITAQMGDNVSTAALSDGCFDLSDNFISVIRDNPDGGTVQTTDGETSISLCAGDGIDDIFSFEHTTSSTSAYAYVITDDQNNILGIPPGNSQNFDGAGQGICRVWGLSYSGMITAQPGDNAAAVALSNECFELSSNFITVDRTGVDGGEITTISGETSVYTCPGDGVDDVIEFNIVSNESATLQIVVTDDQLNVLGLPPANMVNFEGAGVGNCYVWALSYTGDLLIGMGDNVGTFGALTDGCFDLSDEFVTVSRDIPDGGNVATVDGETTVYTCPGDGIDDVYAFATTDNSNSQIQYVVTDADLNVLGLPPGNEVNFEGAGVGECYVWTLAYTGNVLIGMGDNVGTFGDLTDGCFDLSDNFVTVNRDEPDGGMVATVDGETTVYTCPGDGIDDVFAFAATGTSNSQIQYVVTDDQLNVLGLPPANMVNFEGAGVGNCYVWALSYTGDLLIGMGDNVGTFGALTDGCFDLSDEFVTVSRDIPDGGNVATVDGETTVYTCPGDGIDDVYAFATTDNSNSQIQYVVTDADLNVLGLPPGNEVNFEGAGVGECYVWTLAYTGNVLIGMGDNVGTFGDLTDGCFDLSDNFVTVNRDEPDGGMVATTSGEIAVETVAGDGNADVISFMHTDASNSQFAYVITDDQNNILGIPPGNSQDFEGAGEGVCRVWGLAYTGEIIAEAGDNAADVDLSDGCFDLSDNFIEVTRIGAAPNQLVTQMETHISPNPVVNSLYVEVDMKEQATAEITTISVYNIAGSLVYNQEFLTTDAENEFRLQLENLREGIYKVQIQNGQFYRNMTFVKQ
jgi:hypothetical protein